MKHEAIVKFNSKFAEQFSSREFITVSALLEGEPWSVRLRLQPTEREGGRGASAEFLIEDAPLVFPRQLSSQ